MAYVTQKQLYGSTKEVSRGTAADRAESGKVRLRSFYSQSWAAFKLVHYCTTAEKDAILSHYNSNATLSFDMTYQADGQTYTVRYLSRPRIKQAEGTFEWHVEVQLVQV